jgi:hypothetical protein
MKSGSAEYTAGFERFLRSIGVSGEYFCEQQHERWIGRVRAAFEAAEASTTKPEAPQIKSVRSEST